MFSQQIQRLVSRLVRSRVARRLALVAVLVTSLVAGFLAGWVQPVPRAIAQQVCGAAYGCTHGDNTATASVTVNHRYWDEDLQQDSFVEPVDTDTWLITAKWYTNNVGFTCVCTALYQAQATVKVTWSDANQRWDATCTSGCSSTTGPIRGVTVCPAGGCGDDPPTIPFQHSWAYELIVDIDHTLASNCSGPVNVYLAEVGFAATDLDDGEVIDGCEHGITVTPDISGAVGATDFGTFECAYSCDQVTGPSVTIEYVLP